MPDEGPGIGERDDDVYSIGRSPLWDGDPLWDRQLFYDQPENRNAPSDIVGQPKSLGLSPLVTEPYPTDIVCCAYCGQEMPLVLPEDGEAHRCFGVALPGTVVKLPTGAFALVLESSEHTVTYFEIPAATTITLEKFLKDIK
jgi:hypothetical protein